MSRCVSFIIQGDEALADELAIGTIEELQEVIVTYLAVVMRSMKMLKTLACSISKLIGKQKQ